MATRPEHAPGNPAPAGGIYEMLNVLGSPTGIWANVGHGELLPSAPHGCSWIAVEDDAPQCRKRLAGLLGSTDEKDPEDVIVLPLADLRIAQGQGLPA